VQTTGCSDNVSIAAGGEGGDSANTVTYQRPNVSRLNQQVHSQTPGEGDHLWEPSTEKKKPASCLVVRPGVNHRGEIFIVIVQTGQPFGVKTSVTSAKRLTIVERDLQAQANSRAHWHLGGEFR